jgi:uncharacterized protein YecT (DUF1311 family)
MKKHRLTLAALLSIAPSTITAATPSHAYAAFDLTKAEINDVIAAADASCPKKSDDVGSVWAAEPLCQAACRNTLVTRSEAQLNTAYKRAREQLSKSEQKAVAARQAAWLRQRYVECSRERNANLGGALRNVYLADCKLLELQRRTHWIARRTDI